MPYGMSGTSGMMGMGMGLGPMAGYYSGSNMAASLLAQSKSNFGKSEFSFFQFFTLLLRRMAYTPPKSSVEPGTDSTGFYFSFIFLYFE